MHQNASKFDKIAKLSNCNQVSNVRTTHANEMTLSLPPSTSFRLCRVTHSFLALQSSVPKKRTKMRKKENPEIHRDAKTGTPSLFQGSAVWATYKTKSETKANSSVQQQVIHRNPLQRNCSLSHSSHILNASKPVVF